MRYEWARYLIVPLEVALDHNDLWVINKINNFINIRISIYKLDVIMTTIIVFTTLYIYIAQRCIYIYTYFKLHINL